MCLKKDIKIIGLADHGNVKSSKTLRDYLSDKDITVFPGFEISTSEKIHIVCLFDEKTSEESLERYLGALDLLNIEDGISPSQLSFSQIADKIKKFGGFWYAAHVTHDNGVLKQQQQHIWKSNELIAAQIPAKLNEIPNNFINIINNKDPNYKKDVQFALINAKDISKPEELAMDTASCLVKMSEPTFNNFKIAFKDPEARIKLTSDIKDDFPQASINRIEVFGGYLDELCLEFSPNLNTIIGGRGTGKSTLLELLRYALEKPPLGENAKRSFESICDGNFGSGSRIEISVVSHEQYGKKYKIVKRFNEPVVVKNEDNTKSNFGIEDIFPNIEIYSQHEIIELTEDESSKLKLLDRFIGDRNDIDKEIKNKKAEITANSKSLLEKYERFNELNSQINQLPILREQKKQFDELGISSKLNIQGKFIEEEGYLTKINTDINNHKLSMIEIVLPFNRNFIEETKNKEIFNEINKLLSNFNEEIEDIHQQYETMKKSLNIRFNENFESWKSEKYNIEEDIKAAVKSLDKSGGKEGQQIANEYTSTLKKITQIEPLEDELNRIRREIGFYEQERSNLIEQLNTLYDSDADKLRKAVKTINEKKLKYKVKIDIYPKQNKKYLLDFLSKEKGLGAQSLKWINDTKNFNLSKFIGHLNAGEKAVYEAYKVYGLQYSKAQILAEMSKEKKYELEIIDIPTIIDVQLNVGSKTKSIFKSLNKLSKGQQATAILNILMLDNDDPLIVDQPEDNLDNAYIANNLVNGIRQLKLNRQFIFATHNANIPVFGDAELICVMEEKENLGTLNKECIGSVDNDKVKKAVVDTLEGGNLAFKMRREKYDLD